MNKIDDWPLDSVGVLTGRLNRKSPRPVIFLLYRNHDRIVAAAAAAVVGSSGVIRSTPLQCVSNNLLYFLQVNIRVTRLNASGCVCQFICVFLPQKILPAPKLMIPTRP